MTNETQDRGEAKASEFERLAQSASGRSGNPLGEFWYFIGRTRKYWMIPIIAGLLVFGFLVVTGGTVLAPLIYTLF